MAKENLPKDSATIPWREVPDLDDSPQRSPDSKSALRAMALPNEARPAMPAFCAQQSWRYLY